MNGPGQSLRCSLSSNSVKFDGARRGKRRNLEGVHEKRIRQQYLSVVLPGATVFETIAFYSEYSILSHILWRK